MSASSTVPLEIDTRKQRAQQVPQHVTALLSHLTSRPGVQSTLILSRKDGSIIQSTGELAAQESSVPLPAPIAASVADSNSLSQSSDSPPASPALLTPSTYQPSQAEALAAHIFAFVSSASALGITLSRPVTQLPSGVQAATGLEGGYDTYGNGTMTPRDDDRDGDSFDREEEDEVKLLRLRTRKHEIVVVPDRKYLLCVVHGATNANGGPGAAGTRVSR